MLNVCSVCHVGSPSGGHYTAYARHPVSSQWHYFNDSQVDVVVIAGIAYFTGAFRTYHYGVIGILM